MLQKFSYRVLEWHSTTLLFSKCVKKGFNAGDKLAILLLYCVHSGESPVLTPINVLVLQLHKVQLQLKLLQ